MYQRQLIVVRDVETVSAYRELPDTFEVRTDRPHVWLQRACCYILRKLGATSTKMELMCKSHSVDVTDLFDEFKVSYNLVCDMNGRPPRQIFMGREDFEEFTSLPVSRHVLTFDLNVHLRYYAGDIYGLKVYVLPWMRGILVAP